MSPQRIAQRPAQQTSRPTWRPRQLTQRRAVPSECARCGALVADLDRHRAWHAKTS